MRKKITMATFVFLILPAFTLAANKCTGDAKIGECVSQVYIWSLGAAGILALLMIVIGGYVTMTAAGNAERATRGKSYITSSLIGLALLIGAYLLLNTINPDLTNFNLDLNPAAPTSGTNAPRQ